MPEVSFSPLHAQCCTSARRTRAAIRDGIEIEFGVVLRVFAHPSEEKAENEEEGETFACHADGEELRGPHESEMF